MSLKMYSKNVVSFIKTLLVKKKLLQDVLLLHFLTRSVFIKLTTFLEYIFKDILELF